MSTTASAPRLILLACLALGRALLHLFFYERGFFDDAGFCQQAGGGIGGLGARFKPALRLFLVNDYGFGVGEGVVMTDAGDEGSITRGTRIGYHNAVTGALFGSDAA